MKQFNLLLLIACFFSLSSYAQSVPAYVPTNGLVGWWPFNGNANDESGNGNHGTVNGATLTVDRNGAFNSAFSFDGLSNYISGNIANFSNTSITSLSVWVKYIGDAGGQPYDLFFEYGQIGSHTFTYGYNFFGQHLSLYSLCFTHPYSGVNLQNNWHHIVVVDSLQYTKIYIDGAIFNNSVSGGNGNCYQGSNYFLIGGGADNQYTTGSLDDIAIYNRALTQQEITALYTSTPPCFSISSQPSNSNTTPGSNATFTTGVTTTCSSPISYQWQTNLGFGWQNLQNAGQYTGVNTTSLQVSNVGTNNTNQQFRCIVSTGNLSDTSQTASINIVSNSNVSNSGITHAIPYQAAVRDGSGNLLNNHPLLVRCSLHENTASGTILYQETHNITTNNLGLFTLQIGTGTAVVGNMDSINWALYKKFVQIEIDTTAQGSSYTDLGTQQLMAVPYALYAETAGKALSAPKGDNGVDGANGTNGSNGTNGLNGTDGVSVTSANITNDSLYLSLSNNQTLNAGKLNGGLPNGTTAGEMLYWNGTAWVNVAAGTEGQFLKFQSGTPTWKTVYTIGMEYQGGIIAYILKPGDQGYDPNTTHGLIVAPFNQSTGAEWGCYGTGISGADATAIFTGNQNTIDIMNGCSQAGIAARICGDLVLNGYSDWYLPSKDELALLYTNKGLIGGFAAAFYWSSSETNSTEAWLQYFGNGNPYNYLAKHAYNYVRAVRSF